MAAPNIVSVTTITGKTQGATVGTSAASFVSNSSASGKVFKINSLVVSNVDGSSGADLTAYVRKNNSDNYHLAKTITVPAQATLVVISKDTSIYLEENDSIWLQASAASDLEAVCSYEEITDD